MGTGFIQRAGLWAVLALPLLVAGCTGAPLRGVGAPTLTVDAVAEPAAPVAPTPEPEPVVARQDTTPPPLPVMGATREEGVAEIRAKSAARPDIKPNVFDIPTATLKPGTPAERAIARTELRDRAQRNLSGLPQGEAGGADALKRRAQQHYDDAVGAIEN